MATTKTEKTQETGGTAGQMGMERAYSIDQLAALPTDPKIYREWIDAVNERREQERARHIMGQIDRRLDVERAAGRDHAIIFNVTTSDYRIPGARAVGLLHDPGALTGAAEIVWSELAGRDLKPTLEQWVSLDGQFAGTSIVAHFPREKAAETDTPAALRDHIIAQLPDRVLNELVVPRRFALMMSVGERDIDTTHPGYDAANGTLDPAALKGVAKEVYEHCKNGPDGKGPDWDPNFEAWADDDGKIHFNMMIRWFGRDEALRDEVTRDERGVRVPITLDELKALPLDPVRCSEWVLASRDYAEANRAEGIYQQVAFRRALEEEAGHNYAIVMNVHEGGFRLKPGEPEPEILGEKQLVGAAQILFERLKAEGLDPTLERWETQNGRFTGWNIVAHFPRTHEPAADANEVYDLLTAQVHDRVLLEVFNGRGHAVMMSLRPGVDLDDASPLFLPEDGLVNPAVLKGAAREFYSFLKFGPDGEGPDFKPQIEQWSDGKEKGWNIVAYW